MSTTTVKRRKTASLSSTKESMTGNMNAQVLASAIADFEVVIYKSGNPPLYELVKAYGKISSSNTIDTAFLSFSEIRESLKTGEAGYCYNEEFGQFTLAMCLSEGGIAFASLLHDKDGSPRVDEEMILCRVIANRDFELNGVIIIEEGKEFLKALPESYVARIK